VVLNTSGEQTSIELIDGQLVGKREIPGSDYLIFAGTKYILIPQDEDITVQLNGTDAGRYTLTTARLADEEQSVLSVLADATTTPTMQAQFSRTNSEFSVLQIDQDGDGEFERQTTLDGVVITEDDDEISFASLETLLRDFGLSAFKTKVLVRTLHHIERLETRWEGRRLKEKRLRIAWRSFTKLVERFEKRGWITLEQKNAALSAASELQ
jgi:hypothetical protein